MPGEKNIFQEVYDNEINFEISCFWDGGFTVQLGDRMNGFKDGWEVDTWEEVETSLASRVVEYFPDSKFAKARK